MLPFLWDKSVVGYKDKEYIPQYCFPSDMPLSRNASTEKKIVYWKDVDPILAANKQRVLRELKARANITEIKAENLAHVRKNLNENKRLFDILEIFQHRRKEVTPDEIFQAFGREMKDGESTQGVFQEEFIKLVKKVSGLEHIKLEDFQNITPDMWANLNSEFNHHRRDALAKWKTTLAGAMCINGKCVNPSCGRKRTDYHPIARKGFHGSHDKAENKSDDPSKLASKMDGSFLKEILRKDIGVVDECSRHHDKADVSRGESLPPIKYCKIIPSKPSERRASDGGTNHLTLFDELKDRYRNLKHASYFIDTYLRGCYTDNNSCDYDTKRMSDYYHWSDFKNGDVVLTDDFSLGTAREWNHGGGMSRIQRTRQTLIRIMIYNSKVCYAADELESEEAEQRYKSGETMNEDDFVCKQCDFCFRNLAPIEYGGISGDHNNDATKLFNPSDGKDKNIFDMYDELIECPWHCDFCHGIRQYHQEEGSERRCYYLK